MNLRRIAVKNVWQKRGRYLAYLGSAAFSVMVYFLYTALALHPSLRAEYQEAGYIARVMQASAVVIAVFALLFMLYSGSAFVRSRMKEFGLLTLLGLTRRQLIRMILWENVLIAMTAIATGLGLGLLFLKLFFMVISLLLQLPAQLPVYLGWPVWRQTLLMFCSIFLIVSLLSLRGVLRSNVIELIRAGRRPQEAPTFSKWRALLGLLLVGGGYAWACSSNPLAIMAGVVPVTAMVSVGTYFLLRETSIALLRGLRRIAPLYHRPGPFLSISQLTYKVQENYRVLSATAILTAVILSAVGTIFTAYVISAESALTDTPQAVQLAIPEGEPASEHIRTVEEALTTHGVHGLQALAQRLPRAHVNGTRVTVAPYSLYQALYRPMAEPLALPGPDGAIFVEWLARRGGNGKAQQQRLLSLEIGESVYELTALVDASGRLFNEFEDVLVISDERFARLVQDHPEAEYRTLAFWTGREWRSRELRSAVRNLRTLYPPQGPVRLTTTLEVYESMLATFGLALFIGVFISLLFFAAACSLLYFRLFTEIDEDRRYYVRLRQLGLSGGELRSLARRQAMVIFLVPFLVGLMHSAFAMKALSTLTMRSVLQYGLMVAAGYLVLYVAYFVVTYTLYWRTMGLGNSDTATYHATW